jgi:hypothetical protein
MKRMNKELIKIIISSVFIGLGIILLSYLIVNNILQNKITKIITTNDLIIEYPPNIKANLNSLTDINGLNSEYYSVNVTNTSNSNIQYEIILTSIISDQDYVRVSIDNGLIRTLSNYEQNNCYKFGNYEISPGITNVKRIRMWLNKETSPYNSKSYKFKIEVHELNK